MKSFIPTLLFVVLLFGCATETPIKKEETNQTNIQDSLAIFADFMQSNSEKFLYKSRDESISYHHSFAADLPQELKIPVFQQEVNNETQILSKEKYQVGADLRSIELASTKGDCDSRVEEFTILKKIDAKTILLKKFKWRLRGTGECGSRKSTNCNLDFISQDILDLENKTMVNENKKIKGKRYWQFWKEKECQDPLAIVFAASK